MTSSYGVDKAIADVVPNLKAHWFKLRQIEMEKERRLESR